VACGLAAAVLHAAPGPVVTTEQVRAELVAHAPAGLRAGPSLWLGLRIDHQPGWHTYWKNPGDSGLPTSLRWSLPAGFTAGEIAWPTPRALPLGALVNFGYEGTLLLPVEVTVPAGFEGTSLPVRLKAEWLVCKDVCIPEEGEFALDIPARAATVAQAPLFAAAQSSQPMAFDGVPQEAQVDGAGLSVRLSGLPADWQGRPVRFFPEVAGVIDNAAPAEGRWENGQWQARIALSAQRSASPEQLPVVLVGANAAAGVRVVLPIRGPWPTPASTDTAHPDKFNVETTPAAGSTPLGLLTALAFALVGGALLNLMPCVFPILSLKVMGFTAHTQDRRGLLAGGLAYTAGVVLSFVALAGLLLALRAGGEQLGWGFQLQSPIFVAALAALFTLIGLNLAGLFEFGSVLPASIGGLRARHPAADAALTGVLAVAVASPCTAPFMGASLGWAVTLPAAQALSVFAALGLGMAAPYLAASAWPGVARALPRPGPWMAHFKTAMAFPMFATVVWLLWVLGQQLGVDAVAGLLGLLVALAFAAWVWGATTRSTRHRALFGTLALGLLVAAGHWIWPTLREADRAAAGAQAEPASGAGARSASAALSDEGRLRDPVAQVAGWQPWSEARVAQALAEGQPVFVDFTAAWCVTCQFNKRTTLNDPAVLTAFESKRVLLLRADWTRRDPEITRALARLGRNGVPVYLLLSPDGSPPRMLGEVLSVREVVEAISGLR
jgi:thiol:disulfide interchange protein DsbD